MRYIIRVACYLVFVAATPAAAERMVASWYDCCNPKTASGYPFSAGNPHIAAHRTLAFGTKLLLAYRGRSLCVTVRDRGPFVKGKQLDVTEAAAERLGFKRQGVATLAVRRNGC